MLWHYEPAFSRFLFLLSLDPNAQTSVMEDLTFHIGIHDFQLQKCRGGKSCFR